MTHNQPAVYIVDDDDAVRDSLSFLMKSVGLSCQVFPSAQAYLEAVDTIEAGCLVLDIRMPGMSGLELQKKLNAMGSMVPIIFITGHGDVPMAVQAMRDGALDFVQKPFRDQDLIDCINHALDEDSRNRSIQQQQQSLKGRVSQLTDREREVMQLVVAGKANKVIAAELGVSQRTVEIHRSRVMEKMRARSLAQLVRMAIALENRD
jgi:RNA polymerase sigma factor (sigma-70 family)